MNNKLALIFTFILLFTFSNIYVYVSDYIYLAGRQDYIFIPKNQWAAMEWFKNNTGEEARVFTGFRNSNIIPGFTGRYSFIGHSAETVNFSEKRAATEKIFATNNDDEEKKKFLKDNFLTHLYYTPEEKKLGTFTPSQKPYLKLVYQNGDAEIYEILVE